MQLETDGHLLWSHFGHVNALTTKICEINPTNKINFVILLAEQSQESQRSLLHQKVVEKKTVF